MHNKARHDPAVKTDGINLSLRISQQSDKVKILRIAVLDSDLLNPC
jgi:hypothetical protein